MQGYVKEKELGRGDFGIVYKVTKNGKQYAMKEFKSDQTFETEKNVLIILSKNDRDHYFVHYVDSFVYKSKYYIVMDFIDGYKLNKFIQCQKSTGYRLSLTKMKAFMLRLLTSLKVMHKAKLEHRDIKFDNIMYTAGKKDQLVLLDYGLMCQYRDSHKNIPKCLEPGFGKNILFGAPEDFVVASIQDREKFKYKGDIWAMGLIIYCLMHGLYVIYPIVNSFQKKFKGKPITSLFTGPQYFEPLLPSQYGVFNQIVMACLTVNPLLRPRAKDLVKMLQLCS